MDEHSDFKHTCYCMGCAPARFPQGPQEGEGHVAIRFQPYMPGRHIRIFLDDQELHSVIEANVATGMAVVAMHRGVRGMQPPLPWSAAYIHRCLACGIGICRDILCGKVRIAIEPTGTEATHD